MPRKPPSVDEFKLPPLPEPRPPVLPPEQPPSKQQAWQFAIMVHAGMPAIDTMAYFYPGLNSGDLHDKLRQWQLTDYVQSAVLQLQGKPWQEMERDERMRYALDLHYSQMAYFLFSHNYCTLEGAELKKADICRQALEQKIAGNAGLNALTQWWADIRAGKITLEQPTAPGLLTATCSPSTN